MNSRARNYTRHIISEYSKEDVCMGELLASEKPSEYDPDLTVEDLFQAYIECMKLTEGDEFFVVQEGVCHSL